MRFSDVKLEHSISLQDSWQDSSFGDSCQTKIGVYGKIDESNSKNVYTNIKGVTENNTNEKYTKSKAIDDGEHHRLGPLRSFMASTENLINSSKEEQKVTKGVIGVVIGLLFGVVLMLLAVYSFDYSFEAAAGVVVIFTIVICLGFAFSSHCRCIITLFFPSLFTDKGRALFLSVLLSLMITYPVANIVSNVKITGGSMACIAEIAANQSRLLQEQLRAPIVDLSGYRLISWLTKYNNLQPST